MLYWLNAPGTIKSIKKTAALLETPTIPNSFAKS